MITRSKLQYSLVLFTFAITASRIAAAQQPAYPPQAPLEEIRQDLQTAPAHPRLLATSGQLSELAEAVRDDPLRRRIAELVVKQAQSLLDEPPLQRKMTGRRLLHVSRDCIQRVLTLATAYHLTRDAAYAQRCEEEMLAAARFSDWNPSHFLDVAEMTFALGVGYDWLYDQLDETSRQEIRTAIVEKALKLPFTTRHNGWVRAHNNWGQVCHGGMTAGALAILEDEPELAARTVHNALQNVTVSMAAYAPVGSYPEGPGYWSYGSSYNALLIAELESALGSDYGLSQAPGFAETGAYLALTTGPSGRTFNYADGGDGREPDPILPWFAQRFDRRDWLVGERARWEALLSDERMSQLPRTSRFLPLALLWVDGSEPVPEVRLPLSWHGRGKVPVTIHRSSWTDPNATFVGVKAGSPSGPHGQMDVGSFVLDSDGVRWALDLGAENYHGIESRGMNLWSSQQDSDRWAIFRQSNVGHNTLVIDGRPQSVGGDAPIVSFSDGNPPHTIVDLAPVYQGQAASVRRGVMLLPCGEVVVQDELEGLAPGSVVRWGMITRGRPDDLGGEVVTLHQDGKTLTLMLLTGADAGWQGIDTARPRNEWDSPNPGTRMMALESTAPESGKLTLAVLATPGSCKQSQRQEVAGKPLSAW